MRQPLLLLSLSATTPICTSQPTLMEARQSRASSRYASGPSPPLFTGRVRRWKKQWVSSPAAPTLAKRNDAPPLLLCRWTPLSAADEPPARRFRYTPIVPIVKREMKSVEEEGGREMNKWNNRSEKRSEEKDISKEEAEGVNEDEADSDKGQEHGAV